jgi:CRP/FNR family transcriptional regulator
MMEQLTDKDQEFLNFKKKQLLYARGENLFKQGAFATYVLYIQKGLVKIYLQTAPHKRINIRIAGPGDFLAISSIFGEDLYTYSAVALDESEICMIDKEGLKQVLLSNRELAVDITTHNFRCEGHLFKLISSISQKQMRGKLATALLYLASATGLNEDIFRLLSRQDIAEFAAITTESAIRYLKEFEKANILVLKGKDIRITDHDKLSELSEKG